MEQTECSEKSAYKIQTPGNHPKESIQQAFDSLYMNKIIDCLAQYKVPAKLIRLIGLTLINTRATVKINNDYTEEYRVESGLKQGNPLSATLFGAVLDVIIKQLDLRGSISTNIIQCVLPMLLIH